MCVIRDTEQVKPTEESDESDSETTTVSTQTVCPILDADNNIRVDAHITLSFILHMAFESQFICESIKYRLLLLQWKSVYFVRLLKEMKDTELLNLLNVLGEPYSANKENLRPREYCNVCIHSAEAITTTTQENLSVMCQKIFDDVYRQFDRINITIVNKTVAVSMYKSVAKELIRREQFYNLDDVKEVCETQCKSINELWQRFERKFQLCHKLVFDNKYTTSQFVEDVVLLVKG